MPSQFNLHGENIDNTADVCKDHSENILLTRPFTIAFGLMFCGYENFIEPSSDGKKNSLNFDKEV